MTTGALFSRGDEVVQAQPEGRALSVAKPADARRQSLEMDLLPVPSGSSAQGSFSGNIFQHQIVGDGDVGRISGQRDPTERTAPLAEKRPDVGRDEAREIERIRPRRPSTPVRECCSRSRMSPRRATADPAWRGRGSQWNPCSAADIPPDLPCRSRAASSSEIPREYSRSRDRGRWSDRSRHPE